MSNNDKQYEEDLERAQALSLESLALEQFKNKRLQELNYATQEISKDKNTAVVRASSMNESDFSQKYDQYSSRPRPGTSSSNKIGLLIDPPPSSQKKSVPTSNDSESPDLISFSTTPHNTKKIINISNQQTFISKKILHNVHSNIITNQSQLDNSLVQDLYRTNLNSFSEILPNKKQIFSTLPRNQVPPLPLTLKSETECEKKVSNNLIDLSSDKNNVRVSILEEFDPLLSSGSYRTMSQDLCVVEDAASVSDSVYEEYDPYDYIHAGYNGTSVLESINTLIVKPDNLPHSPIPVSIKPDMEIIKGDWSLLEKLIKHDDILRQIKDPDLIEFYAMVYKLRNEYDYSDINRNIGLVISPMITIKCPEGLSVKLCVHPDYEEADFEKPLYFTCDVTTSIEHITLQLICELEAPSKDKYTLKVKGYDEYLVPTSLLSDYEYVHNCIKLEEDIVLILIPDNKIEKFFLRTKQDDTRDKDVQFNDILSYDLEQHINYESLTILIDTLENEMKKLDIPEIKAIQPQKVIQSVKCIVNLLGNLCTLDVIDSIEELQNICDSKSLESVKTGCNKIRIAIQCLLEMYSKAFLVNFKVTNLEIKSDITYVQDVLDPILIKVCLICRPLIKWKYHSYYVDARICHGSKELAKIAYDDPKYKKEHDMWPDRIVIDLWFQFDNIKINSLARESRLVLVIHGRILDETDNENNIPKFLEEEIGWASVQFFDFDGKFKNGKMLLTIWSSESNGLHGPAPASLSGMNPTIEVDIIALSNIKYPKVKPSTFDSKMCDFNSLDKQTQEIILDACNKNMLCKLQPDVRELIWDKRHYLYKIPTALPKVLLAATTWSYFEVSELHGMLKNWTNLNPVQAMELLLPTYPDIEVRTLAVKLICGFHIDELIYYLPQLVVALRFETYNTSSLAHMLLEFSLRSPRFSHYLFWILSHKLSSIEEIEDLKEASENLEIRNLQRLKLMYKGLIVLCGEALRNSFLRQQVLVKKLNNAALVVQHKKDQTKKCLVSELNIVDEFLNNNSLSLPLSPSMRVIGLQVSTSSYIPSFTMPLKLNFIMKDKSIKPAIFKVGDDLQQDMLTLQMIKLMDKLWLHQGLDLKMVTFSCVPTGFKKGMIEMVVNSETLRKIQIEHGLTGSLKDKPIAEWLEKHNSTELEYERAVQNFTASCAGYCVATYVLGICDRHNDNIMLKTSGHLFHIDFGKFLGDTQMFGNFKRDRVPFVLTSDMAYVINGGDKPTEKFHKFVDLCCQAFNIIRNNANIFLCIFTMMASSGISGVTANSVSYLKEALLLEVSNPEAAATFARMIQSSLKSWFTQVNFFLHNIAQLKFTFDNNEGSLLTFVSKVYSMNTDDRIVQVTVAGCTKRYDPDKYYVYLLRVFRENQNDSTIIQRTYKEFCELHQKLCMFFPLAAKIHSLSTGLYMGRSNIKQVAQKRLIEISKFVASLFECAFEICHSDLVYTFFHPLLRDQQDYDLKKYKDRVNVKHTPGKLSGQIKFSLEFSKQGFSVMIHHVRGLPKLLNGQEPSTYVKVYLKPDENKDTKRKTKVVKKNCHPSFMEMLVYRLPKDKIQSKTLQATVWNYDALQENEFMGGVELDLCNFDFQCEITEWYPLKNVLK